jgi:hypothetical protein
VISIEESGRQEENQEWREDEKKGGKLRNQGLYVFLIACSQ